MADYVDMNEIKALLHNGLKKDDTIDILNKAYLTRKGKLKIQNMLTTNMREKMKQVIIDSGHVPEYFPKHDHDVGSWTIFALPFPSFADMREEDSVRPLVETEGAVERLGGVMMQENTFTPVSLQTSDELRISLEESWNELMSSQKTPKTIRLTIGPEQWNVIPRCDHTDPDCRCFMEGHTLMMWGNA